MTWTRAAAADELPRARPWLARTIGGVDIVFASVDATWYAVEDHCSHAGCMFSEEADLRGSEITCNCHGSEFDIRTGAVRNGPAERPIRTFAVRVWADGLEVDV